MLCTYCHKKECVKDEFYCQNCCKVIDYESIPKTMKEWKVCQTTKPPLLHYQVCSESNDYITYNIEFFKEQNCYSCTCPYWKIRSSHLDHNKRTCKHIICVRGIENEQKRIHDNGGIWYYKLPKKCIKKRVLVLDI